MASDSPTLSDPQTNVGVPERVISVVGGVLLAAYGLSRRSPGGAVLALVGAGLAYRGATGHSHLYSALRLSTAGTLDSENASIPHNRGIKVEQSVTINRSPEEVYRFWRQFENLPRFMDHLESVTAGDNGRSHWVAKGPAGKTVEWDAEIINEQENALIAWRSLPGADVDNAGSVRFAAAPGGGNGTEVRVVLEYDPPGGVLGAAVAKLWGEEPNRQVTEDLRRLKQVLEAGDAGNTEG